MLTFMYVLAQSEGKNNGGCGMLTTVLLVHYSFYAQSGTFLVTGYNP